LPGISDENSGKHKLVQLVSHSRFTLCTSHLLLEPTCWVPRFWTVVESTCPAPRYQVCSVARY